MTAVDITMVVCARNYEQFVSEAIDSCLNQMPSGLSVEIIGVDDGSDDRTAEIMRGYSSEVHLLRTEGVGIERAFNTALTSARGGYVVRVDADDALEIDYLSKIGKFLNGHAHIVYGDYSVISASSEVTHRIQLPDFEPGEVIGRGDFLATGTAIRRDVFDQLNMYQTNVKNCGLENYELVCRAILHGLNIRHVRQQLFKYRIHKLNLSKKRRQSIISYGERLMCELGLGGYQTGPLHPYYGDWR